MFIIGLPIGIAIGIVLGIVGAGGALLATPLFLSIADFSFLEASTSALLVVLCASIAALIRRERKRELLPTALFAIAFGALGVIPGTGLATILSDQTSGLILICVLLFASAVTWNSSRLREIEAENKRPVASVLLYVFVGTLTGLTGVGGGFILTPGLILLRKMQFQKALTLSLMVVTGNAAISLISRFASGVVIDEAHLLTVLTVVVASILGSLIGTRFSQLLKPQLVQRIFALVVIALAAVVAFETFIK